MFFCCCSFYLIVYFNFDHLCSVHQRWHFFFPKRQLELTMFHFLFVFLFFPSSFYHLMNVHGNENVETVNTHGIMIAQSSHRSSRVHNAYVPLMVIYLTKIGLPLSLVVIKSEKKPHISTQTSRLFI